MCTHTLIPTLKFNFNVHYRTLIHKSEQLVFILEPSLTVKPCNHKGLRELFDNSVYHVPQPIYRGVKMFRLFILFLALIEKKYTTYIITNIIFKINNLEVMYIVKLWNYHIHCIHGSI